MKNVAAICQERRNIADLKPAEYNPRKSLQPGDPEYESLKRSIETFGYVDPIIVNKDGTVIGGHQRLSVLVDLGYTEADVAVVDLNKNDEKALNIALNKISGEWDNEKLAQIFSDLDVEGYSLNLTGFSDDELARIFSGLDVESVDEHDHEPRGSAGIDFNNLSALTDGEEDGYEEFEEKFKPKKTTDDCYTPMDVYETIRAWTMEEYGIGKDRPIVRPFYPGGDYEKYEYPAECVVIDNPPFSILASILDFYTENQIDYFLFAPTLTLFGGNRPQCRYIVSGAGIRYENGALVNTSFVTNMEDYKIRVVPELTRRINEVQKREERTVSKYEYPVNVVSAALLAKLSNGDVEWKVRPEQCAFVRQLDAQKQDGKSLYGGGYLVSDGAAAERAAAERAAAERAAAERAAAERAAAGTRDVWSLSDRERGIVESLNEYDA